MAVPQYITFAIAFACFASLITGRVIDSTDYKPYSNDRDNGQDNNNYWVMAYPRSSESVSEQSQSMMMNKQNEDEGKSSEEWRMMSNYGRSQNYNKHSMEHSKNFARQPDQQWKGQAIRIVPSGEHQSDESTEFKTAEPMMQVHTANEMQSKTGRKIENQQMSRRHRQQRKYGQNENMEYGNGDNSEGGMNAIYRN